MWETAQSGCCLIVPQKLLKVLADGDMSLAQLIEYLERESGAALPHTIVIAFKDVAARSARVEEAGEALLYRVQDAALALELAHDRALQRIGVQLAGSETLVVPHSKASAFRKRVREVGCGVRRKARVRPSARPKR